MARKSRADIKKSVKAIVQSKNLTQAYQKIHPDTSVKSAKKNQHRLLKDPRICEELERVLDMSKPLSITKDNLVKVLGTVIALWQRGQERTENMLRTVEILAKLVPDFASKSEIHSYQHMSDEELDREITRKYKGLLDARN